MAGALMQLVAYGAQDVYLTGNPQITFFKVVYRRHTNFAMESMEQTLDGDLTLNGGTRSRVTCKVARNGDLLGATYLEATLANAGAGAGPANGYCNRVGFQLIRNVELRIGGQLIDRHTGTWMYLWTELSNTADQKRLLNNMVGGDDTPGAAGFVGLTAGNFAANTTNSVGTADVAVAVAAVAAADGGAAALGAMTQTVAALTNVPTGRAPTAAAGQPGFRMHVPLQFSFCRNPGLALPLIALQYHEVELNLTLASLNDLDRANAAAGGAATPQNISLWCDYIFLDTAERKTFAQNPHEYLIETVQSAQAALTAGGVNSATQSVNLTFNHPVKELVWVNRTRGGGAAAGDNFTNFTDGGSIAAGGGAGGNVFGVSNVGTCNLRLNGQDRFVARPGEYFNQVQPYQHHTGSPVVGVNCYSFALKPEEHQPSGTCNFSRIDNAELNIQNLDNATGTLDIFAHGYNVLRVASGMGGLAYSN